MRIDAASGAAPATGGLGRLQEAARSFEAVFAQMLLSSMRSTVKQSSLFHGGRGEEVFRDLLDRQFAEGSAKRDGGLGISKLIVEKYRKHVGA